MSNITMPGVTLKDLDYRGFLISWQEPPMMGRWTANVATNELNLLPLMKQNGSKIIDGRNHDDMIAASKKYIDGLFG
jgi:hypothetical protein